MISRFGIEVEVLERALNNLIRDGYMCEGDSLEDLESMTYSMCEGIVWYVQKKIYQWANE